MLAPHFTVDRLPELPEFGERGVGYDPPPPSFLPKDSECPLDPPCTDLFVDPKGVLLDRARWPKRLCKVGFMRWSTLTWANSQIVEPAPSPDLSQ